MTKISKTSQLTESEMIAIIQEKRIDKVSKEDRRQVMVFAFGEDFIDQKELENQTRRLK
jgi:hypothetical protein